MKKICILFIMTLCLVLNTDYIIYAQNNSITFSFPVKIKWGHSGLDREQTYKIELEALAGDTPMPRGTVKNTYTKTLQYHTKISSNIIPDIQYKKQGNYQYKLTLFRGKNKAIKTYYIHNQVLNNKNGNMFLTTSIRNGKTTGNKTAEIRFIDPEADKPFHDREYNEHNHKSNKEQSSKEINERNKKNKNNRNRKGRITGSSKTGDERKIEFYLGLCMISLGVILIIGRQKISHRE